MHSERRKDVEEIFDAAIERAPGDRHAFLLEACAGDESLIQEVVTLIDYYEHSGQVNPSPAAEESIDNAPLIEPSPLIGRRIGAYRIVREIDRGGMGTVFLAVRADDAFQKRVAIKLIKRGMDTDFVLSRFRRERQILASLDHPNIAPLLDGGTTEDGLPYFVMEYIEGQRLYHYCDAQRLNLRERINLFRQICDAVYYAHQNLVVHRDIKPSNILVTADGTPRLLDFGIAKLLNPELSLDTIAPTATEMRLMTPEYASPEQVRGERVTPASDIYSLGILLFELLTGHRPYGFPSRAPHEIARVICEDEADYPSYAVSRSVNILPIYSVHGKATTLEQICQSRDAAMDDLRRELSGNLDYIILKALHKEAWRRYQSVDYLRRDIIQHQEGRPIPGLLPFPKTEIMPRLAGRQSVTTEKSVAVLPFRIMIAAETGQTEESHLGVGLTDALVTRLSNIGGITVRPPSALQHYEGGQVDPVAAGDELGVSFVVSGSIRQVRDRIRVSVQLLDVGKNVTVWARQYDEMLADVLSLEDAVSAEVAEALVPLGSQTQERSVQTNERSGQTNERSGQAREAEASAGAAHTSEPPATNSGASVFNTADPQQPFTTNSEANQLYLAGRYHMIKRTPEGLQRAIANFESAVEKDERFALAYANLADCYALLNWYIEPPPTDAFDRAKAAALKAVLMDEDLSEGHVSLAFIKFTYERDWIDAVKHFQRAVKLNPTYTTARHWYALCLSAMGRHQEAVSQIKQAEAINPRSPVVATAVANVLYFARRFDEVITQCHHALGLDPGSVGAHAVLRWAYEHKGMHALAFEVFEKERAFAGDTPTTQAKLAHVLAASGRVAESRRTLAELLARPQRSGVTPYEIAVIYSLIGDLDEAFEWLSRAEREHAVGLTYVAVDPHLDNLRQDARLQEIVRHIGLAQ
jgi:serine/threonine protein kinase/Tfp pilus assembly protein PilF